MPTWLAVTMTVAGLVGAYYAANKLTGSAGRTASAAEVTALAASLEKERTLGQSRDTAIRNLEQRLDVADGRARSWVVFGHDMLRWAARHDFDAPLPEVPDQADPWTGALL